MILQIEHSMKTIYRSNMFIRLVVQRLEGLISTAGKYKVNPGDRGKDKHIMFAFLRDPLERFISSVGQAMGKCQTAKKNPSFLDACISKHRKPNCTLQLSRQRLECAIHYVNEYEFESDVHFTPQALETAFATQRHYAPVLAVFKFEDCMKYVLSEINGHRSKP